MDGSGPDLLQSLWRYKLMVASITLGLFALSTGAGLLLSGPEATATATVALTVPGAGNVLAPGLQGDASLGRYTSQRALFARSDVVLGEAAASLPSTSVMKLRGALTVTPSTTSTSMVVEAVAADPEKAVAVVQAVTAAYGDQTRRQLEDRTAAALASIQKDLGVLSESTKGAPPELVLQSAATTLSELTRQSSDLRTESAVFGDGVDFVQAATINGVVEAGPPLREMALGLLLGIVIASTLAWLRADRDRRISTARTPEALLGAPLLGEIPRAKHAHHLRAGHAELTKHYREIVAPLLARVPRDVVMVTAAERGAGCTTASLGIAAVAAGEGSNVLVIDGDVRRRGLSAALDLDPEAPGLAEASEGDGHDLNDFWCKREIGPGLKVMAMSAGGSTAGDWAVTASGLRSLLDRLRPHFDMIVVDAPLPGTEYVSSVISGMVDSVLVVVRRNAQEAPLMELGRTLALSDAPVLGYVFTFGVEGSGASALR